MKVLISGASIAGPALAYWLVRHGHSATVVELTGGPRAGGYPVDLRGSAVTVAERMDLLLRLHEMAVDTERLDFVRADGRVTSSVPMRRIRAAGRSRDIEIRRGDLVRTLYAATENDVEYRFRDSVKSITQDDSGVDVTFEHGPAERYDVVVGADGLHSQVRALAFGPESDYLRYLGLYAGGAAVDPRFGVRDRCLLYNVPGRATAIYSFGDEAAALFLFRRPELLRYDYRDTGQQKRLLADAFAGDGWKVPELLPDVLASDEFYFDSVSQIRMREWSRGRVVLVGDAGYGPALLSGSGTSLALVGAYLLAGELAGGDGAFARYEAAHRPLVLRSQRSATSGSGILVPRTTGAIGRRDLLARLSWLQIAAARLARRRLRDGLPDHPTVTFTQSR